MNRYNNTREQEAIQKNKIKNKSDIQSDFGKWLMPRTFQHPLIYEIYTQKLFRKNIENFKILYLKNKENSFSNIHKSYQIILEHTG